MLTQQQRKPHRQYTLNGVTKRSSTPSMFNSMPPRWARAALHWATARVAQANYLKFTGLTASSLSLTATPTAIGAPANPRAPINGIQIVADGSVASTDLPGTALPA